jgi:hypothetical protein
MVPTKVPVSRSSIPEPTMTTAGSIFDQTLVRMVDDLMEKTLSLVLVIDFFSPFFAIFNL